MSIIRRTHDFPSKHEHEHEHILELRRYNKQYTCDGCKEQGFGSRYKCENCGYELHNECMYPKPTISHEFFDSCIFEFYYQPLTKCSYRHCNKHHARCCDACGKDICGYVYHCRAEGWDLHPCCRNLDSHFCIDGTEFVLRDKVSSRCLWCKKKKLWGRKSRVPGWSYVSTCEKYHFHVHCVTEMVHEAWKKRVVVDDDGSSSMALEKMELRLVASLGRHGGGKGSEFWKKVRIFLKTIVGILLGDPTITLACALLQLLSN